MWPFLPRELREASVDQLAEIFVKDVISGINDSKMKAGIIGEIGTSYNRILEEEENVLRAAGRVNRRIGVPISTHTTLGTMAKEQVAILKEEGADLRHVVICHMDLVSDFRYHIELAREGVFLGFDTVGKEQYQSDEQRVMLIH
jgi:phosphotriesterase-related protein